MNELTPNDLLKKYEKVTKETSDEMFSTHGPYWKARGDLARLLITLSSAILALTITFVPDVLSNCILPVSILIEWMLLIIVVASCIGSLWFTMEITAIYIHFVNQGPMVQKTLEDGALNKEKGILTEYINNPFKDVSKNDKKAWRLLKIGMICFLISLIMLCIIGINRFFFM
jgi:hypothetical protein